MLASLLLSFRRRRNWGLLLAATAAALGAGTIALAAAAPPPCATSGLVIWLDTQGNGTAGSIYYNLEFTNQSGHTCTLRGYPGVSAVDLSGHQLGSAASRNTVRSPHLVTLANGKTAVAVLRIVDVGVFSSSLCHRTPAAGLRVFPPNRLAAKNVPFPFAACSRRGTTYLSVEAVR
jgi:uncharacterized protein DUF4232